MPFNLGPGELLLILAIALVVLASGAFVAYHWLTRRRGQTAG